jgi:hypothetical protein
MPKLLAVLAFLVSVTGCAHASVNRSFLPQNPDELRITRRAESYLATLDRGMHFQSWTFLSANLRKSAGSQTDYFERVQGLGQAVRIQKSGPSTISWEGEKQKLRAYIEIPVKLRNRYRQVDAVLITRWMQEPSLLDGGRNWFLVFEDVQEIADQR